jgi:hypothetical protein
MTVKVTINATTQVCAGEDLKKFAPTAYGIACQMEPGSRRTIRGVDRHLIVLERLS